MKDVDSRGKMKFRPIHTARLTDLICMVSILNCLMFEDTDDRKLSDLSKLIPHNFYGNIPSTDVQFLFIRWKKKFKEYTDTVIKRRREYSQTHQYSSEISLDIENFFPSISPKIIYDYITNKLSLAFEDEYDRLVLHTAVAKLLYLKLNEENIAPWRKDYYPEGWTPTANSLYMACGIAQGLPQSYFFGNLCMTEVAKRITDEECFEGDAYFYVDDSVIFVDQELNGSEFSKKIKRLNEKVTEYCKPQISPQSDIENIVPFEYLDFHKELPYLIKFSATKSTYYGIDDANFFRDLGDIAGETSMTSMLLLDLDEIDVNVSKEKLNAIIEVISNEIKKGKVKKEHRYAYKVKMLERFKKFYLNRIRTLKIITEDWPKIDNRITFETDFPTSKRKLKEWLEQKNNDILRYEYWFLIEMETLENARKILSEISHFEKRFAIGAKGDGAKIPYLFYSKDATFSLEKKKLFRDPYQTLTKWCHENFKGLTNLKVEKEYESFKSFITNCGSQANASTNINHIIAKGFNDAKFTAFVAKNSSEFQRRIINAYFSTLISVSPSDSMTLTKNNNRRLCYLELRILAYLRNKKFNPNDFSKFVDDLDEKDVSNKMGIDMALLEVLNLFINFVKKPIRVDDLIQTHQITKSLWGNGSKFLNAYTLHNEEHAVKLIDTAVRIVKRIDHFSINSTDYYILFLACYLHDISMVIHPDLAILLGSDNNGRAFVSEVMLKMADRLKKCQKAQKGNEGSLSNKCSSFLLEAFDEIYKFFEDNVRRRHPKDSAKFIRNECAKLFKYLDDTLLYHVANVSESHGDNVEDVYGIKSKEDKIPLKYLMILLRLADSLDVANDRVNYYLLKQNLRHLSLVSRFHWISHLVTDSINLESRYETDQTKGINEKPITETLDFNLSLNIKDELASDKKRMTCERCQCNISKSKSRFHIEIKDKSDSVDKCNRDQCPFLCYWMMEKHEWLVKELIALNDYLTSANSSLIETRVNFNIYYKNEMKLDTEMNDSVREYLNKSIDT